MSYPKTTTGKTPQNVTEMQGENAIFIVYASQQTPDALDKVKNVCANFTGLLRSRNNHFPGMDFSCMMGFGADACDRLFPKQGMREKLLCA